MHGLYGSMFWEKCAHIKCLLCLIAENERERLIGGVYSKGRPYNERRSVDVFSTTSRSGVHSKLTHLSSSRTNLYQHSFFHRMVCLWSTLSPINLSLSFSTIKHQSKCFMCAHFSQNIDPYRPCTSHLAYSCNKCSKSYHRYF